MTNNLRKIKKDLCSFAKRCQEFKYTDSALITFLITGAVNISNNLFSNETNTTIEKQKQVISTSIKDIHQKVQETRKENDKLLKKTNLELIQLMEQGDHVVKSPWSSWQYGINGFYNNWGGTYKGRGDKEQKYSHNGAFERDKDLFNRNVSPLSGNYKKLPTSSNPHSALTSSRKGLSNEYGIASTKKSQEPIVSFELYAGVHPKNINKGELKINTPNITAPSSPIINVKAKTPITAPIPVPPSITVNPSVPQPETNPFVDYGFDENVKREGTPAAGEVWWSGYNPYTKTDQNDSGYNSGVAVDTPRVPNIVYLRDWTGHWKENLHSDGKSPSVTSPGYNFGGTPGNSLTLYAKGGTGLSKPAGGSGNVPQGQIAIHSVWNGTLHDIDTYLKGKAAFLSIETWHSPKVKFGDNVNVEVDGDKNTVFYMFPGKYATVVQNAPTSLIGWSNFDSWRQRGEFSGKLNVDMKSNKNSIYSIMGVSGSFKIESEGIYRLEGSGNTVYSNMGYSPDYQKIIDNKGSDNIGDIFDAYGTGMTPIINFKTAPEIYGDENVITYFSKLVPDGVTKDGVTYPSVGVYPGWFITKDGWKKSKIGIFQGEIRLAGRAGEQLNINNGNLQSANGNTVSSDEYVENTVGLLAESGQRGETNGVSIDPVEDLGAKEENGGTIYTYDWLRKDKIHPLYVNDAAMSFGRHSLNGMMFVSANGSQVSVAVNGVNTVNSKDGIPLATVIKDYRAASDGSSVYSGDNTDLNNDGKINSSSDSNKNEAATGTIIAYAKGKWNKNNFSYTDGGNQIGFSAATQNAFEGAPSEINIGVPVETSSRYAKINGTDYFPIAYVAVDEGKVTAKKTTAHGYGSIIGYASGGGSVEINGDIIAQDGWALDSDDELSKNIGIYATGQNAAGTKNSTVTVTGNATINGIGAYATDKAVVTLAGTGNMVNVGKDAQKRGAGLLATQNGIVHFGGGDINVGDTSDEKTVPFYAETNGKIDFTNTTNINMTKGFFLVEDPADYNAASGTSHKYNGMGNVNLDIQGDAKAVKVFDDDQIYGKKVDSVNHAVPNSTPDTASPGKTIAVWNGGSVSGSGLIQTITKVNTLTTGSDNYNIFYLNGKMNINADVDLGNATDGFNNLRMTRELVTVNSGKNVTSSNGTGLAMASNNNSSTTSNSLSGFINKGNISISGGNKLTTAATNVSYGIVQNENKIAVDNGTAVYGTNGSKLVNDSNGEINVGNGYGIIGQASVDPSNLLNYGTDNGVAGNHIEIINKGKINIANGNGNIGIYANNNRSGNSEITSIGKITASGDHSVGIASVNSAGGTAKIDVSGTGTKDIVINGNTGIGIYADNTLLNLNSNYGVEMKDGGVGVYVKGTSAAPMSNTLEYRYSGTAAGQGIGIFYETANAVNNAGVNIVDEVSTLGGISGLFANGGGTFTNNGNINGGNSSYKFGIISENNTDVLNNGNITLGNASGILGSDSDPAKANVGIFAKDRNVITNKGNITVGKSSVGIYGYDVVSTGDISVGDSGVGIYSKEGNVTLSGNNMTIGNSITDSSGAENGASAVYITGNGQTVTNNAASINIGDGSFGIVNASKTGGNTVNSNTANVTLGNDSVYIYSGDTAGTVTNKTALTSTGERNYGIYSAGNVYNDADIDFASGAGNIGIYSTNGGRAENMAGRKILVGGSNVDSKYYGIGMAAGFAGDSKAPAMAGNAVNNGIIEVKGQHSVGMYGTYNGTVVENNGRIVLDADDTVGIYVEEGAKARNTGTITTSGSHKNVYGVYLGKNSTLENTGTIHIDSTGGAGILLKGGTVVNYGTITGTSPVTKNFTNVPTTKTVAGVTINAPAGASQATVTVNTPSGLQTVTPVLITTTQEKPIEISASSIGMYINTSGRVYTKPIGNIGTFTEEADLIVGSEAAGYTNNKYIQINDPNILGPYNQSIVNNPQVGKWNIYSGSLTWMATPTLNSVTGEIANLYMAKIPYTNWAGNEDTPVNSTDTYNFADGLEQRYGIEALGNRENQLFQRLNSIGNNEEVLLYQAFDEMMGHQYANTQMRINATGNMLDKEFRYLKHDWRNPSKQNNKIKVFGMRDQYKTDTAGIIDYTSNAWGVAYVHEDEKIKMGNSDGWYAGVVTNRFKFSDIGHSKEDQTMLKAGVFKTMSPKNDYNGALQWTIGGDVFAGINNMKRKFLVVDDVFEAKSNYNSYGAALKTDLGYDIRMSERTHLRPYGALKMEYGRFNNIKEDSGQMRLEVKGNDYFSVKPEIGVEFKYVQPMAVRTNLSVGLTAAYENELGKIGDVNNEARVRYTNADWFGIRGEKEDRRGNGKFDLNIGVDNTRFGVTVNAGYDTKGSNVRGGIGFRAIY